MDRPGVATVGADRQILAEQEVAVAIQRPAAGRRSDDGSAEVKRQAVDPEAVALDGDRLAGEPDDALEQETGSDLARWPSDEGNVAASWRSKAIGDAIDQDALAIAEQRAHALAPDDDPAL